MSVAGIVCMSEHVKLQPPPPAPLSVTRLIYSGTSRKAPHPHQKTAGGRRWWIGTLDLLIPCNSSFLLLQIPSAPGTLSGAKLMLSQPQSSFDCNQGIQYVTLFNTMYVIQREKIGKYMFWHLYRDGGNRVPVFITQGHVLCSLRICQLTLTKHIQRPMTIKMMCHQISFFLLLLSFVEV